MKKFNNILILDAEATCSEPQLPFQEIIEIGVCSMHIKSLKISDPISILVKPTKTEITEYCTNLTGITKEDVESGSSLEDAFEFLKEEFNSRNVPWASWGNWDRRQIEKEAADKELKYPMSGAHLDIKTMFSIVFGLSESCALNKAMELLGLKFKGIQHNAGDDAYNAALTLKEALRGGPLKCLTKPAT